MPTVSNDYLDLRTARFTRIRQAFIEGLIGEATYRVSLGILGLRAGDIDDEIALAKQEQR
jgi:hypothetical protein